MSWTMQQWVTTVLKHKWSPALFIQLPESENSWNFREIGMSFVCLIHRCVLGCMIIFNHRHIMFSKCLTLWRTFIEWKHSCPCFWFLSASLFLSCSRLTCILIWAKKYYLCLIKEKPLTSPTSVLSLLSDMRITFSSADSSLVAILTKSWMKKPQDRSIKTD